MKYDIESKLKELDLETPSPIVILPDDLEFANSKDDLNYSFAQIKAILYLKEQNVNAGLDIESEFSVQLSAESEIARIVLNILVTHADQIAMGVISAFLYDLVKGKLFGKEEIIKVEAFKESPNKNYISYEGPISGLKPTIEELNKLNEE